MKFIIYSPPLDYKIGGTVVLHQLAKDLIEHGSQCQLYISDESHYENVFCNAFATKEGIDDRTVVIYPEVVEGNPLNAKHVIRWMLCDLGVHTSVNIYKSWNSNDLVFHYSTFNSKYDIRAIEILYTTWMDPNVKNKNFVKSGSCYLFKKASSFHKQIQLIHPPDALLIDPFNNSEIIEVFQQKKFFYCYDPYSFYDVMAALCGCIPVIYPIKGVTKKEWLKTRMAFSHKENISGIAYGREELPYAENSIGKFEEDLREGRTYEKNTVKQLIIKAKGHFFNAVFAKNTVANSAILLSWDLLQDKMNLEELIQKLNQQEKELNFMKSSKFWRLRQFLKNMV